MEITVTLISIFLITGLMWFFNKISPLKICPICAGVSGTWLWILAGIYFGLFGSESWRLIAAMAMGGSVVGIVYQLEKRPAFAKAVTGRLLLWKTLFIPAGFLAVYGVVYSRWGLAFFTMLWLLGVAAVFLQSPAHNQKENEKVEELERKMRDCC